MWVVTRDAVLNIYDYLILSYKSWCLPVAACDSASAFTVHALYHVMYMYGTIFSTNLKSLFVCLFRRSRGFRLYD